MNERDHIHMPASREMDTIIVLLEEGRNEEALDALDALLVAHPPLSAGLLAFKAAVLRHLSRDEEALACYDRILDKRRQKSIHEGTILSRGYIDAHLQKAVVLEGLNHDAEALAEYTAALRLRERDPVLHSIIGLFHARKLRFEAALTAFEQAQLYAQAKPDEDIPLAYHLMNTANALSARTRYQQAIALYEQAVQLGPLASPLHQVLRYNLAYTLALDGQGALACSSLNELLQQDPTFLYAYFALAEIAQMSGRQEEADDYYHRLLRLFPSDGLDALESALATFRGSDESVLPVRFYLPIDLAP